MVQSLFSSTKNILLTKINDAFENISKIWMWELVRALCASQRAIGWCARKRLFIFIVVPFGVNITNMSSTCSYKMQSNWPFWWKHNNLMFASTSPGVVALTNIFVSEAIVYARKLPFSTWLIMTTQFAKILSIRKRSQKGNSIFFILSNFISLPAINWLSKYLLSFFIIFFYSVL